MYHMNITCPQMTQSTTPSAEKPQWFSRGGAPVAAERVHSIDLPKGTARYSFTPVCGRCGGRGGSEAWSHTGWKCYQCGGTGKGEPRTEPVYTEERLAKLVAAQEFATKLEGVDVTVARKAGVDGRLFGSVTNYDVAEALKALGFEVEKSSIRMPMGPLKAVGETMLEIALHTDVLANVKVHVVGEQ